jgi:raffinose/stachyose/melibiose transport system substrate-binding protein
LHANSWFQTKTALLESAEQEREMKNSVLKSLLLTSCVISSAGLAHAADVTLNIESWRNDDLKIWQEKIIPAFEAKNPGIKVTFSPTAPTEYNASLNAKLDAGSAGDIITCRPFDASLELFKKGQLTDLTSLPGMDNFSPIAKAAWTTDDGKSTFCVPMAAVIHGFIYNKDAFDKLGIKVPTTSAEFYAALDKIKTDGTYIPMAMGTKDLWEAATMGYQNIGPNFWKGEDGRQALLAGKQKLTDSGWVAPFTELAKWKPYLGDGFEAQTYSDSQNLFTLGRAAIYPAGSWEIGLFNSQAQFKMGAFPPPVEKAGDTCYISDHPDIAVGLNAKSTHPEEAKKFLAWVSSPEFAEIYANSLPGFFSLNSKPVKMADPLAQEFTSWREKCKSTIRSTYQILSRGTPNLENETWVASANVINGTQTPQDAAKKLQTGLDSWFKPAAK